ncbi:hypothetical protein MASR1M45_19510 [Candidatus Kapaibacterium sp.]
MKRCLVLTVTLIILMSNFGIAESDTVWVKKIGSEVKSVKFSPDGEFIYAAALGRKPMKLSTETGEILMEYEAFKYEASEHYSALDISTDGKWLIGGEYGSNMFIIDTETGQITNTLQIGVEAEKWHDNKFNYVSISNDNKYIIACNRFGIGDNPYNALIIWNINQINPVKIIYSRHAMKVEISPDNKYFAVSYERSEGSTILPSEIDLYEMGTWNKVITLGKHESKVSDISFSPDGSLLASCGWDGIIKIWDVEEKKMVGEIKENRQLSSLNFYDNDFLIAHGDIQEQGYVKIWDLKTYQMKGYIRTSLPYDIDANQQKQISVIALGNGILLFDIEKYVTGVSIFSSKKSQIIPNPITNHVEIKIDIPRISNYVIQIFDSNTKLIENIYEGLLENGENTFIWDPSKYPTGTYFCRISGKNYSETLKILIQR